MKSDLARTERLTGERCGRPVRIGPATWTVCRAATLRVTVGKEPEVIAVVYCPNCDMVNT